MRSPLWNLLAGAARIGATVELHIDSHGPISGVPTLPVAANHVTLQDGRVVSLPAVRVAELVSFKALDPELDEVARDAALTDWIRHLAHTLDIEPSAARARFHRAIEHFARPDIGEPF